MIYACVSQVFPTQSAGKQYGEQGSSLTLTLREVTSACVSYRSRLSRSVHFRSTSLLQVVEEILVSRQRLQRLLQVLYSKPWYCMEWIKKKTNNTNGYYLLHSHHCDKNEAISTSSTTRGRRTNGCNQNVKPEPTDHTNATRNENNLNMLLHKKKIHTSIQPQEGNGTFQSRHCDKKSQESQHAAKTRRRTSTSYTAK